MSSLAPTADDQREKRIVPRGDDHVIVVGVVDTVNSPLTSDVYSRSNSAVGQ
jgi:hypothetical protein